MVEDHYVDAYKSIIKLKDKMIGDYLNEKEGNINANSRSNN